MLVAVAAARAVYAGRHRVVVAPSGVRRRASNRCRAARFPCPRGLARAHADDAGMIRRQRRLWRGRSRAGQAARSRERPLRLKLASKMERVGRSTGRDRDERARHLLDLAEVEEPEWARRAQGHRSSTTCLRDGLARYNRRVWCCSFSLLQLTIACRIFCTTPGHRSVEGRHGNRVTYACREAALPDLKMIPR
jgi:hypothetical protein